MKIVVTHSSPDWDAIGAVWLIKKFLPGWQDAVVEFTPAGTRSERVRNKEVVFEDAVEHIGDDEIIHVDTGLGPLDHHQTSDQTVSATGLAWEYVKNDLRQAKDAFTAEHEEAHSRIVKWIVAIDHFKEVFWADPAADYHEFSLLGLLEGLKIEKPDQDAEYVRFGIECLEAMVHTFENRIWAEREIEQTGIPFETKYGKGIAFQSLNDTVLKLSQKMGYKFVIRKDPRKGYVRIKVRPTENGESDVSLKPAYEKLRVMDPHATWFLHVSEKMLLNGTSKNPTMRPTNLSLEQIIGVIKDM
jgi:hypothetical protein